MSGGIDSSAAAYLLKELGHEVTGVTFTSLKEEGFKKCCSIEEITSARTVCAHLDIPHRILDVKDIFQAKIIKYFIDSYKAGLTPNPCVLCNRFVKFGALLEYGLSEGAEFVATGHYARTQEHEGNIYIRKGADLQKDQSYFISYIEKEKIPYIIFPLGEYNKPEVRDLVRSSGIPIQADKVESQDICFVPGDYRDFLLNRGVRENPGDFIFQGKIVGRHKGIPFYSYGQRRGLNVAAGERIFIERFDLENNRIILGPKPLSKEFAVEKLNVFPESLPEGRYDVTVRYKSSCIKAAVSFYNGLAHVDLDTPCEIISPGQFAVIYQNDLVYASGIIKEVKNIK